ncbi:MAG TPA: vWA domain-containing protein [Lacipirellulaceae bacterium]|nr:vWA domain-containing protein [Lacipirellulaceae bacterium]
MTKINEFDLAFVVDTTGSMGGLIKAAQKQMVGMVDALATAVDVDMRLGIVEYRDHPPQDRMIYRVYNLTDNLKKAKKAIDGLSAEGGGDEPEAVYAGIVAACDKLAWRRHSRRMAVLVGDAPPHGAGCPGDGFPRGCPSGQTMESVSARAEEVRVTLYALGLSPRCAEPFDRISGMTGGRFFPADEADKAMAQMKHILENEFGQLEFDREIYHVWESMTDPTVELVAQQIEATLSKVAAAVCRLQSRGFLLQERVGSSA